MPTKGSLKYKLHRRIWIGAICLVTLAGIFLFTGSRYDSLQVTLAKLFPSNNVILGKVLSVTEQKEAIAANPSWVDALTVQFLTGSNQGQETVIHNIGPDTADPGQKVKVGETIILAKSTGMDVTDPYYMTDRYRLPSLLFILLLFILAVIIFGGMRGLSSLVGLGASIGILIFFVVPHILAGQNPLLIGLVGAVAIAVISLYLAHGFNRKTTIAVIGTLLTLVIAVGLTVTFTSMTHLLGIGTEESAYLKIDVANISLQGLLLAGIIIGMLGVLDDVTIGQTHTVAEIHDADPSLDFKELYRRATNVGKEHIASLVNTLFLAYVGVSFPLFLLLIVQSNNVPIWLAVNGEPIAEEIVRTLVGSMALIAAVPITTLIAAYYFGKRSSK